MERIRTIFICVFLFNCVAAASSSEPIVSSSGCNYCVSKSCTPTVLAASNFNAREDMKQLQSKKRDENAVISILTSRSDNQRIEISKEYITTGSTLIDDIKKIVNVKTQELLEALMKPLPLFLVDEIHDAIQSNDYNALFEILGSLPNCAIREISFYYRVVNKVSLIEGIVGNYYLGKLLQPQIAFLRELAKGDRDENDDVDEARAEKDAKDLASYMNSRLAMSNPFIRIFTKNSFPQLRKVLEKYNLLRSTYDKSIIDDVKNTFKDELQDRILIVIGNVLNQHVFFARTLDNALYRYDLDSDRDRKTVIRIIRSRWEVDLEDIKIAFKKTRDKSLKGRIEELKDMFTEQYAKWLKAVIKEIN